MRFMLALTTEHGTVLPFPHWLWLSPLQVPWRWVTPSALSCCSKAFTLMQISWMGILGMHCAATGICIMPRYISDCLLGFVHRHKEAQKPIEWVVNRLQFFVYFMMCRMMTHVLSSSPLGRCNYNIHVRSNDVGQNKIDVGISFFWLPKKYAIFH